MIGVTHHSAVDLAHAVHREAMARFLHDATATPSDLLAAMIHELAVVIVGLNHPAALALALEELPRLVARLRERHPRQ